MSHRLDRDATGEARVPQAAYWGPRTQRALDASISTLILPAGFVRAQGIVKRAVALANMACNNLDLSIGRAIVRAAEDVLEGGLNDQFVVDVFADADGTAHNDNANEVIANRAIELLGRQKGDYAVVDPTEHVNRAQATGDVTLTALHVAALEALTHDLTPALHELHDALLAKAKAFAPTDAHEGSCGPLLAEHTDAVSRAIARLKGAGAVVQTVPLGATGNNSPDGFQKEAVARLNEVSRLGYTAGSPSPIPALNVSAALRELATLLQHIVVNVRSLALNEPVSTGMLRQVCVQAMGCDAAVAQAALLQPYGALPVLAWNLLHTIEILSNGTRAFSDDIDGLQPGG